MAVKIGDLTRSTSGMLLSVAPGADVSVELGGTGTTGYLWFVEADPAEILVVSQEFRQDDEESIGGMGVNAFMLRPLVAGRIQVTFAARRPWEKDREPAVTHAVDLAIESPTPY